MIQINLLPPEYRPRAGTPVARFVAILAGVILVASASGVYAYTHFIELSRVKELKVARDEELAAKTKLRERSLELQREIKVYENRRSAIQTITSRCRRNGSAYIRQAMSSPATAATRSSSAPKLNWNQRRLRVALGWSSIARTPAMGTIAVIVAPERRVCETIGGHYGHSVTGCCRVAPDTAREVDVLQLRTRANRHVLRHLSRVEPRQRGSQDQATHDTPIAPRSLGKEDEM